MQGLIVQFEDFPGLCVLSHQLPGALGRKVLAEGRLVFGCLLYTSDAADDPRVV